ncbi:thiol-disulfide isomerase, partial [Pseudomonas aeruginosa]
MASLAPVFRVNAMTPRRKTLLVSLVGLLWAGGLLAAYWWFEIRYIRPFSEQTTL